MDAEIEELLLKVGEYLSLHDEIVEATLRRDETFIERYHEAYKEMRDCYEKLSTERITVSL